MIDPKSPATSGPNATRRRWRPRHALSLVMLGLAAALLLLGATGQVARIQVWAAHPPAGRLIDVGGYRLHLDCRGETRGPTVVIDAGQGDFSLSYAALLPMLAEHGRVCAYDRAGLGWSDSSPHPRTGDRVVAELRTLLQRAGEAGPYLLVGQSLGGMHVRLFAYRYRDEVAGLVLLDAAHEDQFATVPDTFEGMVRVMPWVYGALRLAASSGIPALLRQSAAYVPPSMPEDLAHSYRALAAASPKFLNAASRELSAMPETHAQLRIARAGGLGDIPVVALSHETCNGCGMLRPEQLEPYERNWREAQAAVAAESTRGRWQIAPGSGHEVHLDRPDLVLEAVLEVLTTATGGPTPAASPEGEGS